VTVENECCVGQMRNWNMTILYQSPKEALTLNLTCNFSVNHVTLKKVLQYNDLQDKLLVSYILLYYKKFLKFYFSGISFSEVSSEPRPKFTFSILHYRFSLLLSCAFYLVPFVFYLISLYI
jgi:hypothetical protein